MAVLVALVVVVMLLAQVVYLILKMEQIGQTNTGGGGSGGRSGSGPAPSAAGGAGGSGICILKYEYVEDPARILNHSQHLVEQLILLVMDTNITSSNIQTLIISKLLEDQQLLKS